VSLKPWLHLLVSLTSTDWFGDLQNLDRPLFKHTFEVALELRVICEKVLQLFVFVRNQHQNQNQNLNGECVGEAQLNLAEFSQKMMRSQWCNVLGWQILRHPAAGTGLVDETRLLVPAGRLLKYFLGKKRFFWFHLL